MSDAPSQELCDRVGQSMYERDFCAQGLGIRLNRMSPDSSEMTMTIRQDMVNGHGICHGGMTFTLADTAFSYACNANNRVTVAAGCSIQYPAPAQIGDVLTAHCHRVHEHGRSGVYDVEVRNQDGLVVALFRGLSRRLDASVMTVGKGGKND